MAIPHSDSLRLGTSFIDMAKLKYNAATGSDAIELSPVSAVHSRLGDVTAQLMYPDDSYVMMIAGDIITLTFAVPNVLLKNDVRDFIFSAKGYYVQ